MSPFQKKTPSGFTSPIELPQSPEQAEAWQAANRKWWERNPMRYDWREEIPYPEFSREFYGEIDRRFFSNAAEYLASRAIPFDECIDYGSLADKDVLEIGVGNGSHSQLLAAHAKSFTGIDITDYAVRSTTERLKVCGFAGTVRTMDAEHLDFPDGSFDYIWTWGVIHHSSNTERILHEMHRVLRPGGTASVMVYYRGWWNYYVTGVALGVASGELFKGASVAEIIQRRTDGAIARYYTVPEWCALIRGIFSVGSEWVCGPKTDLVLLPAGALKRALLRLIPCGLNRFLTRRCRMGVFLISELRRL